MLRSLAATHLKPALRELLLGELFGLHLLLGLLDGLLLLLQDHFHVARAIHVGVDAAVGTVGAASALLSFADLDVCDGEVLCVEVLELGIALRIPQQVEENLRRFDRPAALRHLELLRLRRPADAALVHPEGHAALLLADILQVLLRGAKGHALDGVCGLVGVLVVDAEISTHGLACLARVARLARELDHGWEKLALPMLTARGALCRNLSAKIAA
mmetsp:Transcript_2715/g.6876  ORF Transcript_2715/g.6876 Transcript_2715/m.6876 type:complete len:216 (-) Transcript_2715:2-649(-)